ncbi:MAG: DUF2461 domain-containing protein [Chitinophagaceae bacterium]|nr:DUF2461 domain-containing protein [Chitinophagaceae bacterium]
MLQSTTLKFLKDLKKNNNKPWFDEHRTQYETARADFFSMIEKLIPAIAKFDEPIGHLTVKETVFRINRDVRFSKDKSPYKNNMACYFNQAGKNGLGAGYYLHIEPGKSFAAGGIWVPEPAVLAGIRQEIDYNFADWKKILENKSFKKVFTDGITSNDTLVRPPKGYDENNPAIEFIKMKSFIVRKSFADADLPDKNFATEVAKTFNTMKPLIDFLNTALH